RRRGEHLGVAHALQGLTGHHVGREHDGGSHHRAGPAAPAHLVHPADAPVPALPQVPLYLHRRHDHTRAPPPASYERPMLLSTPIVPSPGSGTPALHPRKTPVKRQSPSVQRGLST